MSGIAGIFCLDGRPVDRQDLQKMVDVLAHRGPDGAEIWSEGAIGFGHRMLWTTPESLTEKLPLIKNNLIITADARIDNRDELKSVLDLPDRPLETIADSEFILAAYEKWGEDCPKHLLGDFAFTIWDVKNRMLFCARDPMGVKPFYYYRSENLFAFASEIRALLCLSEVPHQLNELRVANYITRFFEDRTSTFYQGILRLPAAHCFNIGPRNIKPTIYWSLNPLQEIKLSSNEEYAEAFLEVFTQAVQCRLRSSFSVGSTLSGGLDSSSIACTARNLLTESGRTKLHTFSAIFPGLPEEDLRRIDERFYVDAVVRMGNLEPHYIRADLLSPLPEIDRLLWHQEEPFPPPNLYIHWAIYKAAQENNVRVLMDGVDGDTTVSHGWDLLPELIRHGRWLALLSEVRVVSQRYGVSPWKLTWSKGVKPLLPNSAQRIQCLFRKSHKSGQSSNALINPAFAERIRLAEQLKEHSAQPVVRTARENHCLDLQSPLFAQVLELADRAAAAFSLEPRYPFFDRRLMEFCVALPAEQKLHQGWGRSVLRRAMTGILPTEVQWRLDKGNLSPNYRRKLLEHEKSMLEQVILDSSILEEYINISILGSMLQAYIHDPMQGNAMAICGATILALWLQKFNVNYLTGSELT